MTLLWLVVACVALAPSDCVPVDGDGDGIPSCTQEDDGTADCNDYLTTVFPGAPESCDGLDSDCDGTIPESEQDIDDDGSYACTGDCDGSDPALNQADWDGDGWTTCEGDCSDLDPLSYPGAAERCDAADNDCDGATDEADDPEDVACADTGGGA